MREVWQAQRVWYNERPQPKTSYSAFIQRVLNGMAPEVAILTTTQAYARLQRDHERSAVCVVLDGVIPGSAVGD